MGLADIHGLRAHAVRRSAAVVALACGLVLTAAPLVYSMFERTDEAERILDRFTFLTLGDNPDRYLAEAEITREGSDELVGDAIPRLAAEAGIGEAELARRYPDVAALQAKLPAATDFSVRYSEQLEAVKDKFRSVYDIPVAGLPLTAVPWLYVLAGLACLAAGGFVLRAGGVAPLVVMLVVGLLIALGPMALGGVGKSADGEDVKRFAENGLTEKAAVTAQSAWASLDAAVSEAELKVLPEIAAAQGLSDEELAEGIDGRFPAAATFLAEWHVIGPRLSRLADAVSASVADFESAKNLPIAFSVWLMVGSGLAMSIGAGLALLRGPDAGLSGV
jgi:hypothetical protein